MSGDKERFLINWLDKLDDLFADNFKFTKNLLDHIDRTQLELDRLSTQYRTAEE